MHMCSDHIRYTYTATIHAHADELLEPNELEKEARVEVVR